MAAVARVLSLLMATLAFANAQCLTLCPVQACHSERAGHCHQHPGKAAPASCAHGQFARTAEMQVNPAPFLIDTPPVVLAREVSPALPKAADSFNASPPLKLLDLPTLQSFRI